MESLVEFIEGGKSEAGARERKQKRKKKKASLSAEGGGAVAEQDKVTLEPISEGLSEAREDSGVCTNLKKLKKISKLSERKKQIENKFHRTNDVASGSSENVEREDLEAEEKPPTQLEKLENTEELFSHPNEGCSDPLTRELSAKEAELHELLESEMQLVESKGKEMSALLSAMDELEDEKQNVDKKVSEIDSQMAELKIRKDQLVTYKEDKDKKLEKLLKKKNKLENFIEENVREQKETKRRLEKEIEEIKARSKETKRSNKCESQPGSLELLVKYIDSQIESKEKELECPVCLEVV